MRGTISECLASLQKVQYVAIAIPESQKLSEPYSLGCNTDGQLALSPSAPPPNSHSSQLKQ